MRSFFHDSFQRLYFQKWMRTELEILIEQAFWKFSKLPKFLPSKISSYTVHLYIRTLAWLYLVSN